MYINLCPFTIGMKNTSPEELSALAVKYGFQGIDYLPGHFSTIDEARVAGEKLGQKGLKWGLYPLPCDFLLVDDNAFKEGVKKMELELPFVQAAGCKRAYNHIWPGNDSRQYKENFQWHVERLNILVDLLSSYDVHLGLEFIGARTLRDTFRYTFIHTLSQALELADAVSPRLGLIIDCFHWYTSGGTLDDIRAVGDGSRIVNVHANDAFPGRTREQQQDLERQMPLASGLVDAPGILKTLKEMNYDGPVICEPFNPTVARFGGMTNDSVAKEVAIAMKELFSKI